MSKRKKSRSSRKRGENRKSTLSTTTAQETNSTTTARIEGKDLSLEYQYVGDDLKRIGIIAAILIGILVGLSFFI